MVAIIITYNARLFFKLSSKLLKKKEPLSHSFKLLNDSFSTGFTDKTGIKT